VSLVGRPSKYTDEFKCDAVQLVEASGRSINDVARELGLCHETLRNWVRGGQRRAVSTGSADGLSIADKDAELARLRVQVVELQVEKEILRKAAAYFAKEMDR
jgi:transposase